MKANRMLVWVRGWPGFLQMQTCPSLRNALRVTQSCRMSKLEPAIAWMLAEPTEPPPPASEVLSQHAEVPGLRALE